MSLKLDPETISFRLKNANLNPDVIREIQLAIMIKNTLDEFKKDHGLPEGYDTQDY